MVLRRVCLIALSLLLTSCGGTAPSSDPQAAASEAPGHPPQTAAVPGLPSLPAVSGSPVELTGWEVTVYYTAVAAFHSGATVRVTGCPTIDCEQGVDQQDLGTFPASFVDVVKNEGTGKTADGRYLNWSHDTGYWMDTAPRDADGRPLRPWVSAAADSDVLRAGSRFTVLRCGTAEVTAEVCARLKEPTWTIVDQFTPGLGGSKHVDLYIGEETGPGFTDSDLYTTLEGATLSVVRA
ncbi:hypothetical protein GCM10010399_48750 [Dactylosporangium fulvum]|uniref:3D domain-containing protein n=1 Tax=Dactylosporangium fulvum TaxID=53359 RepID=A0ABY5VTT7_9ACTN|nr:hypothetical protein [Dactylosporangium fulvum]UWP80607.1 hypothetical protein Dfulv_36385 [Dactylosporangium fulvum]